jgi:hypothetical protein
VAVGIGCVFAFRDARLAGLGISALQALVGAGLLLVPIRQVPGQEALLRIRRHWFILLAYAAAWTAVTAVTAGGLRVGLLLDLIFGLGLLRWASCLQSDSLKRWLQWVIGCYLALNFCAGLIELVLGLDALDWLHKSDYADGGGGRLRMLAAEPSHIYAPLLAAAGLAWILFRVPARLTLVLLTACFLLLAASKAFPAVTVMALLLALAIRKGDLKRILVGGVAFIAIVFAAQQLIAQFRPNASEGDSPLIHLLNAGLSLGDYVSDMPTDEQGSFATRAALALHAVNVFATHPLLGVGPAGENVQLLAQAEDTGLITPEIILYAGDTPEYITSKTIGLSIAVIYGGVGLYLLYVVSCSILNRRMSIAVLFSFGAVIISSFVTEGYNVPAWLALCLLSARADGNGFPIGIPVRRRWRIGARLRRRNAVAGKFRGVHPKGPPHHRPDADAPGPLTS